MHITEDGNPYRGGPDDLLVTSDDVAALYEVPGKVDENGKQHFMVLLRSAARIPDEKRGGGPVEGTPVVSRIQPGIELEKFTEELLSYFPSRPRNGDAVPVVLPRGRLSTRRIRPTRGRSSQPSKVASRRRADTPSSGPASTTDSGRSSTPPRSAGTPR